MAVTKDPLTRRIEPLAGVRDFVTVDGQSSNVGFPTRLRPPINLGKQFGIVGTKLSDLSATLGEGFLFAVRVGMVREECLGDTIICCPNLQFIFD